MRRFLSYFLILILVLPCFIFSSLAAPVDSDNFSLDIMPYTDSYLSISLPDDSFDYSFIFNGGQSFKYIDGLVVTDAADFDIIDNVTGGAIIIESVGSDVWRFHGLVNVVDLDNYILTVNSIVGGSYFNLVKCDIIYDSYMYFNLPLNYYWRDDYRVINGTYDSYPSYMNSYAVNQVGGHESFYMYTLTFDWEKYDYITIFIEDYSTQLVDFSANVDQIDVVSSFDRYAEHSCYITLDFTSLNPDQNSNVCNIGLSGVEHYYDTVNPVFVIQSVVGYVEQVKDSFWSSWMDVISSKFDKLIDSMTGSQQDLNNSNSFNNSVTQQSQELQDLTNVMTSVDQPDIEDINFNLSGVVDSNSVVLATTGFKTMLQNEILLKVLLIAFTFALVGFVLYGKKG